MQQSKKNKPFQVSLEIVWVFRIQKRLLNQDFEWEIPEFIKIEHF